MGIINNVHLCLYILIYMHTNCSSSFQQTPDQSQMLSCRTEKDRGIRKNNRTAGIMIIYIHNYVKYATVNKGHITIANYAIAIIIGYFGSVV